MIAKKKILVVFGTRPEAIKMCPLVHELKNRNSIQTIVCVTQQHKHMLDQVLDVFHIVPEYKLNIMKEQQTLFDITTSIINGIKSIIECEMPDVILVHGDTTTAFSAALAAFYLKVPVGHIEAGLRTFDMYAPFPEEFNRRVISLISEYNFAPTKTSYLNLVNEGKNIKNIWITGNTAIDTFKTTIKEEYEHSELEWCKDSRMILITAHRRESHGSKMEGMFRAINRVINEHEDVKAIYPVHLNPNVREIALRIFANNERIHLIEPLDVLDFHNFIKASYLVLTDSGGIQEEAPSLGKPVLVLRDTTERPEGIRAGTIKLTGTSEDCIYNIFTELLDDEEMYYSMSKMENPYGDGYASERIADILEYGYVLPEHI